MQITAQTVDHVAGLARLALIPEERTRFASDLSNILALAKELGELDLNAVDMAQAHEESTVFRADAGERQFSRDELLANAPEEEDGFFRVPQILDAAAEE